MTLSISGSFWNRYPEIGSNVKVHQCNEAYLSKRYLQIFKATKEVGKIKSKLIEDASILPAFLRGVKLLLSEKVATMAIISKNSWENYLITLIILITYFKEKIR